MSSALIIDSSNNSENYDIKFTLDEGKPYTTNGGSSYNYRMITETKVNVSKTSSRLILFRNLNSVATYSDETRENKGKAKLCLRACDNPGAINYLKTLDCVINTELVSKEINPKNPYVTPGGPSKDGSKTYQEAGFMQFNLSCQMNGCYTEIIDITGGLNKHVLSNDDFDEGSKISTLKMYVKESKYDPEFIKVLNNIYGCIIKVTKAGSTYKTDIVINNPDKCNKRLLDATDFISIMKNYTIVTALTKLKNPFAKDDKTFVTLMIVKVFVKERVNEYDSVSEIWNKIGIEESNQSTTVMSIEDVNASDDFE